ncbi:MAG: Coenzyme F420 hydrogenase/dehydrogenase, beta subunit C-terminal domain [Victivallaceae bacterium]|nr:Coenzyme F420 hydrogenase/dehydrogenase, beta subunit C-terminal domain [Victivallaceae bacterium]
MKEAAARRGEDTPEPLFGAGRGRADSSSAVGGRKLMTVESVGGSCYGCGVCAVVCPVNGIVMKLSESGFWLPSVDVGKCVYCGLCTRVCSFMNDGVSAAGAVGSASAFWHKDPEKLKLAASGGAGLAIAETMMAKGWKTIGAAYDPSSNTVRHVRISSPEGLAAIANSKYIPSYTADGFDGLFDGGKYVVFGTPCQIDSMRRLIRMKHAEDNFLLVDFFCHGVPSYLLWFAYLKQKLSGHETMRDARFRDKRNGWHTYTMRLETDRRIRYSTALGGDPFFRMFLGSRVMNLPCYRCKFRGESSAADIRMGDLWGSDYAGVEHGVSGLLGLTARGEEVIRDLAASGELIGVERESVMRGQAHRGMPPPACRNRILRELASGWPLWLVVWRQELPGRIKGLVPCKAKEWIKRRLGR